MTLAGQTGGVGRVSDPASADPAGPLVLRSQDRSTAKPAEEQTASPPHQPTATALPEPPQYPVPVASQDRMVGPLVGPTPMVAEDPNAVPTPAEPPSPVPAKTRIPRRLRKPRRRGRFGGRLVLLLFLFGLAALALEFVGRPIQLPVWIVAEVETRLNRALTNALPDSAISVGGIEVSVGEDWVPHLVLEDLRLLQPGGQTLLTLPEVYLNLDPAGLLTGEVRAQSLRIVGARVAIRRNKDGQIDLVLAKGDGPRINSLADAFAALDRAFALPALSHLRTVEAEAMSLSLTDLRAGLKWEVGDGHLSIENRDKELAAQFGMTLSAGGGTPAQAVFTAIAEKGAGSARISVQVDRVAAGDLAAQTPVLGWLRVIDAPISGRIAATIDTHGIEALDGRLDIGAGALQPSKKTTPIVFDHAALGLGYDPAAGRIILTDLAVQSRTLHLTAKGQSYLVDAQGQSITGALSGRIPAAFVGQIAISDLSVDPAGLFAAPVQFNQGAVDVRLKLDPFSLDIGQVSLSNGGERLGLSGQVVADEGGWRAAIDLTLNRISRDRLLALWPLRLVPGTRSWVANNVRNADLSEVSASVRIAPGTEPRAELAYSFNKAELQFMPKMPPVTGADGYAIIQGTSYTLVMSHGQITPPQGGSLAVSGSVLSVPDILAHPAEAHIDLKMTGPVTATLSLLDQPPFFFLTKAGQRVDLGSGEARVTAKIVLPLIARVMPWDVTLQAAAEVTDFASDKLVKGHPITAPLLHVTGTMNRLEISGKGLLGKVPFDATFVQEFPVPAKPASASDTSPAAQVQPSNETSAQTASLPPAQPSVPAGTPALPPQSPAEIAPQSPATPGVQTGSLPQSPSQATVQAGLPPPAPAEGSLPQAPAQSAVQAGSLPQAPAQPAEQPLAQSSGQPSVLATATPATDPSLVPALPMPPAEITGHVTLSQEAVSEFGLGLPKGMVSGEADGEVTLSLPKGGVGQLHLTSALDGMTLAIPDLGWRKAAKATGKLEADIRLGPQPEVSRLTLSGPGLTAQGQVLLKADGGLDVARFDKVSMGGWLDGAVAITGRGANQPVGLAVTSGTIDLRKFPANRSGGGGTSTGGPLTIQAQSLRVTSGIRLTGFTGDFSLKGGFNGTFAGSVNGAAPVTGTAVPTRYGTAVRLRSTDAGQTMNAAGLFASAHGGDLDLTLIPRVEVGEYDGKATIAHIRVKNGSVMAELLSAISVIGLLQQLVGDGIVFEHAEAQFHMTSSVIDIQKGSAIGASLGVSLEGLYHSDTSVLDLRGVVSPIYLLNGIGSILTRKGEGLFGFAYKLHGSASDPKVSVNPLSILTPGMFRDLFRAPAPSLPAPQSTTDATTAPSAPAPTPAPTSQGSGK